MLDDVFFSIKRRGTPVSADVLQMLESVVVEQSLTLPDVFILTFLDEMRVLLDGPQGFAIGDKIEIGVLVTNAPEPLVVGEVTAVEAEHDGTGTYTVLRGYDLGHRLQRGRKVRTFINQTYADVVRRVLGEAGVTAGTIESAGLTTHPLVSQNNVSDWEFVQGLAKEVGFFAGMREDRFVFAKPTEAGTAPAVGNLRSSGPLQLALGDELLRFRGVASAVEQVSEVVVRSWDPITKGAVVATASAAGPTSAQLDSDIAPQRLAGLFGGATLAQVDIPDHLQNGADAAAKSLVDEIASASAEFDGVARGNPRLAAGTAISVGLVGKPFDGRYVLTSARHTYHHVEGYTTAFTVSGLRDGTLYGLANGGLPIGAPPIQGVVVAIVTNNKDPDDLLRVKLKFPWLADDYESDGARIVQLGAGAERGSVVVPEVNDEVLVAFDHGDLRRPYVLGGVYNGRDRPHLGPGATVVAGDGSVNHRTVASRTHQTVALIDEAGKEGVTVVTGDGRQELALKAADRKITVTSEGDIEVTAKAGGKMTMDATGDIKVASNANVTIEAVGNVKVKATGNLALEGAVVNVKATGPLTMSGNPIKLN
jgi:uncharacterized protein involved in type VI secretion and phage assembly